LRRSGEIKFAMVATSSNCESQFEEAGNQFDSLMLYVALGGRACPQVAADILQHGVHELGLGFVEEVMR